VKKILDYIEVEFENMDNVYLPTKYFRELILNDVRFNYKLLTNGCMREVMVSYDIYISLKPEANIASLNMSKDGYFFDLKNGDLFERLKQNDILIIKLHYKDNSRQDFYVDWHEDYSGQNSFQSVKFDEFGQMVVEIRKRALLGKRRERNEASI